MFWFNYRQIADSNLFDQLKARCQLKVRGQLKVIYSTLSWTRSKTWTPIITVTTGQQKKVNKK